MSEISDQTPISFPVEYFRRIDETDDQLFYSEPRLVVHIDAPALKAVSKYLGDCLPPNSLILDLMSSWRSHLPKQFDVRKLIGLGLNAREMSENPQLDEYVIHDLNKDPRLPFKTSTFDAAILTVSIQYLVRPIEIFRELNRVLKSGSWFHVIFSNRMFSSKAIAIWRGLGAAERAQLIDSYFHHSEGWIEPQILDIGPKDSHNSDPVYVVAASKQ